MMRAVLVSLICSVAATGVVAGTPGDIVLLKPTVDCPQSQVGDDHLQEEYARLWLQYEQRIEQETKALEEELGRLYEQARSSGQLDLVLFWKGIRSGLAESGTICWELAKQKKDWGERFPNTDFPENFTAVLQRCVKGYAEARAKLEEGYEGFVVTLTQKDKLDEASAMRAEVKALWQKSSAHAPSPPKPPVAPKVVEQPKPAQPVRKPLATRMIGSFGHPNLPFFVLVDDKGNYTEVDKRKGVQAKGVLEVVSEEIAAVRLSNGGLLRVGMLDDNTLGCTCTTNGKPIGDGVVLFRLSPGTK